MLITLHEIQKSSQNGEKNQNSSEMESFVLLQIYRKIFVNKESCIDVQLRVW